MYTVYVTVTPSTVFVCVCVCVCVFVCVWMTVYSHRVDKTLYFIVVKLEFHFSVTNKC